MGECKAGSCCESEKSLGHAGGQHEGCNMVEDMLHFAKCAKHDLLKEKMKKQLEAKMGKKLDKVAELAVDALIAGMQRKEEMMAAFRG